VIVASQNGQVQRRGTEFDPDLAIVTVEIGYGQKGTSRTCRFKHSTFPVENRESFGIVQSAAALRSHLIKYKTEKLLQALSDFHLLIYLAQVFDVEFSISQQLTIFGILLITSRGAAGVTGSGFIVLASTLTAIKVIPLEGLALLIGVDRFMSEARSVTNFIGNAVATVVISKHEKAIDMDTFKKVVGV
jgi:hypothetical protein